jgi:DNA-binding IclR family transcriptional regulator
MSGREDTDDTAETADEAHAAPPASAVSAVRKSLQLLDAFTGDVQEMSIRELARRSGVARSTAHRLASELEEWGALERTPTGGFSLGVKLFELGSQVPTSVSLREATIPYAHHLHGVTRLTVNIAIRDGAEILYLEKITSRTLTVPHSRLGGRLAAHATALGKAILAFSPPDVVDAILATELPALTPKTLTDPDVLRKELAQVRANRLAYDVEESKLGLFCVAAPILDATNRAAGAISVTGATALDQAERFAAAVQTTALAASRSIRPRGRVRR